MMPLMNGKAHLTAHTNLVGQGSNPHLPSTTGNCCIFVPNLVMSEQVWLNVEGWSELKECFVCQQCALGHL